MSNLVINQLKKRAQLLQKIRPTLAQTVVVSTLTGILVSCFVAGYHAQSLVSSSKLVDNWAIMFLESENMGFRLKQFLDDRLQVDRRVGDLDLAWDDTKKVFNASGESERFVVGLQQMGYDSLTDFVANGNELSLVLVNGAVYVVESSRQPGSPNASLKKISSNAFASIFGQSDRKARLIYLVSKQGRLVYSSDGIVNNGNFISRDLVKKFIQSSLTGQIIEYEGKNNRRFFGAVHEIPGTNLVLFSEVSKQLLIGNLTQIIQQYALLVIILVTLTVILISLPITRLSKSLNILNRFARHLGTGDLSPRVQIVDCAETSQLSESMNEMAQSIHSLNEASLAQMEERLEKVAWTIKRNIVNEVQSLLAPEKNDGSTKNLPVKLHYLSPENFGTCFNFDLRSGPTSLSSVLLSEIKADAAEALVYQTIVSGIVRNSIKNTFDDVRTIIKKIDELPPMIQQQSVESTQYHIARSHKGGEIFVKIWSRFGLNLCGVQAPLTESGKINFQRAIELNLGQRKAFETVLLLRPGDVVVLCCHASNAAVLNETDVCSQDLVNDSKKILESVVVLPSMDLEVKELESIGLPQDLISQGALLFIGQPS